MLLWKAEDEIYRGSASERFVREIKFQQRESGMFIGYRGMVQQKDEPSNSYTAWKTGPVVRVAEVLVCQV